MANLLDLTYRLKVHQCIDHGELITLAIRLAAVPCVLLAGPANRIVRLVREP